jgi:hypothetical protein
MVSINEELQDVSNELRDVFDYSRLHQIETDRVFRQIVGFTVYFFVFVVAIPLTLKKHGYFTLLEAYMPNVDMIATVLSFIGGPGLIWRDLYLPSTSTTPQFVSQTLINFFALCGLTYLVARETKLAKSVVKGWSISFVMIIVTYLVPSQVISSLLGKLYSSLPSKSASIIAGAAMISGFVMLEKTLLLFLRKNIERLASWILKL